MNVNRIDRRAFLRTASVGAAALAMAGRLPAGEGQSKPAQTAIPRWRGFNLLDYFSPQPMPRNSRNRTPEADSTA